MSDLYDSLEDDDEYKPSRDSQDKNNIESSDTVKKTCGSCSTNNYSFFLNREFNREKPNLLPVFNFNNAFNTRKLILPKIISSSREEEVLKNIVDNKSLEEQGLQFNNDGSFTKSPRQEKEELPFIAREYRNLQFQKKKTYSLKKKNSCPKNVLSFANKVDDQVSMTQNARRKKGSSDEILLSKNSLSPRGIQQKTKKQANLTDSMKEKLLQNFRKKISKRPKKYEYYRKRNEVNTLPVNEGWQQNKVPAVGRKKSDAASSQNWPVNEVSRKQESISSKKKIINASQKIPKYKSDILLNIPKPKLNYSQRHMLVSGCNPFFLQPKDKIRDDSNRSNFGDSVVEDLPEVSSRVLSCDNLLLEEEEMFYKQLMEKDKTLKLTQQSSRSEGPFESLQMPETNSQKEQKEQISTGRSNLKSKHYSKTMFIDMPSEGKQSEKCKKGSHYCSVSPSTQMSKVELALKGKTYGYLANARNIFRLKAQNEGKFSSTERNQNWKNHEKVCYESVQFNDSPGRQQTSGRLLKQNSLPVNGFPTVTGEFIRKYQNLPRASVSLCKTKQLQESTEEFVLPQVKSKELEDGEIDERLFQRINSCLVSPHV